MRPGARKSAFSHSTEICSSRIANGELIQLNAIWSSAPASQSAASAAGVPPPITKWKNRGPADRVAEASAASISVRSASSEPAPWSGSAPAIPEAASTARGGRTSAESTFAR
jgi:hypothetical protein